MKEMMMVRIGVDGISLMMSTPGQQALIFLILILIVVIIFRLNVECFWIDFDVICFFMLLTNLVLKPCVLFG